MAGNGMARRIVVSVTDQMLEELDALVRKDCTNRSAFVREIIHQYLFKRRRLDQRQKMVDGYIEMASLNRELACSCVVPDEEALAKYEAFLEQDNESYYSER